MANIGNLKQLKYCECKSSNTGHCSNVATVQVILESKKDSSKDKKEYRCNDHKQKGTAGYFVINSTVFSQRQELNDISDFLRSLIGKNIHSKVHTARHLEVKYIKGHGGVMCYQNFSRQWKYVYYNQIDFIHETLTV
jgi:hypothetical protein